MTKPTSNEKNFFQLQNTYLGKNNQVFREDFIIPFDLYQKRNKKLILKNENEYYFKKNTLMKINIDDFIKKGKLWLNQKNYVGEFNFFLRRPLTLIIKNNFEEKKLRFKIDQAPPIIKIVFPNGFSKSNNRYVTKEGNIFLLLFDPGVGIKKSFITLNKKKLNAVQSSGINMIIPIKQENNVLKVISEDNFNNKTNKSYEIILDKEPPEIKLLLTEGNKNIVNHQEGVYYFKERIELSFILKDKYDQSSKLYVNENLSKESFKLFQGKPIQINNDKTVYYYSQDRMENTSKMKRIHLIKKDKKVITY